MASVQESSARATEPSEMQFLPACLMRDLDLASMGTRAALEDLDELADASSMGANLLLSMSELNLNSSQRKKGLRNRRIKTTGPASSGTKVLYNDKQSLLLSLERNPFALEFASEELQGDYDVAIRAVSVEGKSLQFVASCLQADREVVLMAIRTSGHAAFQFASPEFCNDREFALAAVSLSGLVLQHLSPELTDDTEIVRAAVTQRKSALAFASARIREAIDISWEECLALCTDAPQRISDFPQYCNDESFVYAAVCCKADCFGEVGESFQNNGELVRRLASDCPAALRHAKKQGMFRTLEQRPLMLQFASDKLRADSDLVTWVVSIDGMALQYAAPYLQADGEIVLAAIQSTNGAAFLFSSARLRQDKQFAIRAGLLNGMVLEHFPPEFKDDLEVVSAAISQSPSALKFASDRLRAALDISAADALALFTQAPPMIRKFPQYTNDWNFIYDVSCRNSACFGEVDQKFRDDDVLVSHLAMANPATLSYASDRLRNSWLAWTAPTVQESLLPGGVPRSHQPTDLQFMSLPLTHLNGSLMCVAHDVVFSFTGAALINQSHHRSSYFDVVASGTAPGNGNLAPRLSLLIVVDTVPVRGKKKRIRELWSKLPVCDAKVCIEAGSRLEMATPVQLYVGVGKRSGAIPLRGPFFHDFALARKVPLPIDIRTFSVDGFSTIAVTVRIVPWNMRLGAT